MAKTKTYTVTYERDEKGLWVAHVKGIAGCHTQGRTIAQARERIREALSLFDEHAEKATLQDDVRLVEPATARDETRRAIAKPWSTRAAFVVELAERVKALTLAGDLEGARIAVDALQRLLVRSLPSLESCRRPQGTLWSIQYPGFRLVWATARTTTSAPSNR